MTRKSHARRIREKSGYASALRLGKKTHEQMETKAIAVLSNLRPGLSYPDLVRWVNGMEPGERDKMRDLIIDKINKGQA